MASLYPAQLDNFATNRTNATPNDPAQRDDHNDHADAINKIEAELGVAPSGAYASVRSKLDAIMLNAPATANVVPIWSTSLARFSFGKVTDAEVDPAAALAVTKLSPGSVGQVLVTNAGPTVAWGSIVAIPTGVIMPYGGAAPPAGFLLCDGTEISRVTYATLFGVIGVAYGAPTGTTFNLPDFRGRMPVGRGQHAEVDTLGENDGVAVANRTPRHKSAVNESAHGHPGSSVAPHTHTFTRSYSTADAQGGGGGIGPHNNYTTDNTGPASASGVTIATAVTGITVGNQDGTRPSDVVPYQIVNYIIKT